MSDRIRIRSPHPDFPIIPRQDDPPEPIIRRPDAAPPAPRPAPAGTSAGTVFAGVFLALLAFFVGLPLLVMFFFCAGCAGMLGVGVNGAAAIAAREAGERKAQAALAAKKDREAEEALRRKRQADREAERRAARAAADAERERELRYRQAVEAERKRLEKVARDEAPAAEALKVTMVQVKLKGPFARPWLKEIVRDYPGTKAAAEAAKLLKEIGEK